MAGSHLTRRALLAIASFAALACSRAPCDAPAPPSPDDARLESLRHFEKELEAAPAHTSTAGADPWTIRALGDGYVGILRHASKLVHLDAKLAPLDQMDVPRAPTGLAVMRDTIWVASEGAPSLSKFALTSHGLERRGELRVADAFGFRDVAVHRSGAVYALDEVRSRVVILSGATHLELPVARGGAELLVTDQHLLVNAVLEHTVLVLRLDDRGLPVGAAQRITHDGPFWGLAATEQTEPTSQANHDGTLWICAGGVENAPLDRSQGFFGHIDSFAYLYRVPRGGQPELVTQVNTSELGVVVPKALAFEPGRTDAVWVAGYGSPAVLRLSFANDHRVHSATMYSGVPGIRQWVWSGDALVFSNPLLDVWGRVRHDDLKVIPTGALASDAFTRRARLGEALVFTTLMAPWNDSDGAKSRFTCETCHFEGYVDGRTHHTGRADVRATTKPLVGIFGNKPHFTRALDPDLASVAMNEFRVAGASTARDPWFYIATSEHPWLAHLGWTSPTIEPDELRRAFMAFFAQYAHTPNPRAQGRHAFDEIERHGARLFAAHCTTCHAPRLRAHDDASAVPFAVWEASVFSSDAPILWARDGYHRTGVVPYVHEHGARAPSLRRLHKKFPYFTHGRSISLDDVATRVRIGPGTFAHDGDLPDAQPLSAHERAALVRFLELL